MTIGRKISLTCSFLVALTGAVAAIALYRVADIQATLMAITNQSLPGVYGVGKLAQLNRVMSGNMLLHLGVAAQRPAMAAKIRTGQAQFAELLGEFAKSLSTAEEKQIYNAIPPVYDRFCAAWEKIRPLSEQGEANSAWKVWLAEGRPAMLDLEQKLNAEIEFSRTVGRQNAEATNRSVRRARLSVCGILVFAVLCGGGLAWFLVRDLNRRLRHAVDQLSGGAAAVAGAASQVAASSQSVAEGANQQAASIEETAASTEQLTAMTRKNSENSRLASEAIQAVDREIAEGNRTLEEMLASMAEIRRSGGRISKINQTVDEIAFQTNVLALNAAVEAARAGEAGLGFAVVADEVRNLARRSADAAGETAALIAESVKKSTEGSARLEHVAQVIHAITGSSRRVKSLAEETYAASAEQVRGIDQIAKAMVRIEGATQAAAAGAEQSAAASHSLSAQAADLKDAAAGLGRLVG